MFFEPNLPGPCTSQSIKNMQREEIRFGDVVNCCQWLEKYLLDPAGVYEVRTYQGSVSRVRQYRGRVTCAKAEYCLNGSDSFVTISHDGTLRKLTFTHRSFLCEEYKLSLRSLSPILSIRLHSADTPVPPCCAVRLGQSTYFSHRSNVTDFAVI